MPITFESPQPFAPSISEAYGATQTQAQFLPEIVHQQDTTARINEQGMQRSQGAFEQQQQRLQQVGLQQQRFQQQQALQQMDFSQADGLRLQKLQQGMAGVQEAMDNHTLSKEEGQQLMLQIKTGIDPLQMRQQQTMEKMRQQKMKFDMEDHAHQTAMSVEADKAMQNPVQHIYDPSRQGTPVAPVGADVGAAIGGIGGAIQGGVSDAMQAKPPEPAFVRSFKGFSAHGGTMWEIKPYQKEKPVGPTPEEKVADEQRKEALKQHQHDVDQESTLYHSYVKQAESELSKEREGRLKAAQSGPDAEHWKKHADEFEDSPTVGQIHTRAQEHMDQHYQGMGTTRPSKKAGGAQAPSTPGVVTSGQPAPAAPSEQPAAPPDVKTKAIQFGVDINEIMKRSQGKPPSTPEDQDQPSEIDQYEARRMFDESGEEMDRRGFGKTPVRHNRDAFGHRGARAILRDALNENRPLTNAERDLFNRKVSEAPDEAMRKTLTPRTNKK